MSISPTHKELTELSESELIKRYNEEAQSTVVGTKFYLDELNRRKAEQQTVEMLSISKSVKLMTIAVLVLVNVGLFAWTMFWSANN